MFKLQEYQAINNRTASLLPWAAMIGAATVVTKTGEFMSCLRYRGLDMESSSKAEQLAVARRMNNVLKRLPGGWSIQAEAWRRPATAYPKSQWEHPVPMLLDAERQAQFEEEGVHFETAYFLTLIYRTPTDRRNKLFSLLWENMPDDTTHYGRVRQYFEEMVRHVEGAMRDLFPMVGLLRDGELLTYLGQAATLRMHSVALPGVPMYLDAQLGTEDLAPGVRPRLGTQHLRVLSIRSFPARMWPGVLSSLEELNFPYRFVQRWIVMEQAQAAREARKYERKWLGKRKGLLTMLKEEILHMPSEMSSPEAEDNAADARAAQGIVASGLVAYGYYTGAVLVWDTDPAVAGERIEHVARVLEGRGLTVHDEDLNAVEAWAGTIPGNVYANVRMPPIHSMNLAHLMPLNAVWAGPERNEHLNGAPLMQVASVGGTPFRVSLHQGDVGDALLIGPKGAGKSTLLRMIALQWQRYPGAQAFIFEQGMSARAATYCMGGKWYALGGEGGLGLQPLAHIDEADERTWAMEWLDVVMTQEKVEVTPDRKTELWGALQSLATMDPVHRTISGLAAMVQDMALRDALHPYTLGGAYPWLDDDTDHLSAGRWQTFELKTLMDTPTAVAPTLFPIFHRMERWLTGAPTLIILDEGWLMLALFAQRIRLWLKTLRKLNASVIFATQNLGDITESSIAGVIAQECQTRLFLPNPRAMEPQIAGLYAMFGLSPRQIEVIAMGTPKKHFYYQSPSGNRLAEMILGPVAMAMDGSESPAAQAMIDAILARGEHNFATTWLQARGLPWAADLLTSSTQEKIEAWESPGVSSPAYA